MTFRCGVLQVTGWILFRILYRAMSPNVAQPGPAVAAYATAFGSGSGHRLPHGASSPGCRNSTNVSLLTAPLASAPSCGYSTVCCRRQHEVWACA